ncbi:hypothetical protein [Inhella proteolytica]|uniref:Cytochrome c domain-containing protein n=1 Tax=Inhella proteolytica TaxID=2795029 RepID=A0A931NGB9_9BURK|nr:hypothetical protein [Inhella proteolytica]MBH9579737.1 hypothetical protein [Inhella proteolytica]
MQAMPAWRPLRTMAGMRHLLLILLLIGHSLLALPAQAEPPALLSQTGLWAPGTQQPAPGVRPFTPQHVLWSDGADKQRWIRLPPGTRVDARQPDAWQFPVGTRLWKEFRHGGVAVETRFMERTARGWAYASYRWRPDGRDAERVRPAGETVALAVAPGGRYDFPSTGDCLACHADARSPVLGFSALQLGPQLPAFMQAGLIAHAPARWRTAPPSVPGATAVERAARGYLHANCAHCHHSTGVPRPLRLALDVERPAPPAPHLDEVLRRMGTRNPYVQMPPLGTRHIDPAGLALLRAWANERAMARDGSSPPR